jgi:single-strand DNA-binding protein
MSYEAEGKLHKKLDVQQVTDSFKKREFVIEVEDGAYSQLIKFQLTQANCDKLDAFKEGSPIKVAFSIKGREYTKDGKTTYFTNLEAWRLDVPGKQANAPAPAVASAGAFPSVADEPSAPDDDLPF